MAYTSILTKKIKLDPCNTSLLLYICAFFGNRLGTGFDYYFLRGSFVLFVLSVFFFQIVPAVRNGDTRPMFGLFSAWFLMFWAFAYSSSFWSESIANTLSSVYITNCIQACCIVVSVPYLYRTKEDLYKFARLLIIAGLYCIAMLAWRTPVGAWGTERVGEAIGQNANSIGLNMAFLALVCMFSYTRKKNVVYAIALVAFAAIALFSGSRKAFVALMFGVAAVFAFSGRGWKALLGVIAAGAFCSVFYWIVIHNADLYNVLGYRLEDLINGGVDKSTIEREWYRDYAFGMFLAKPIVGFGFNGFLTQMQIIGYSHQAYSHCNQLEILADLGLIGFVLYYWIFAYMLKNLIALPRESHWVKVYGVLFLLIIFGTDYGCVSFVTPDVYIFISFLWCMLETERRKCGKREN